MNCAECRENLVACLEGLLEAEQSRQCQAHLESCEACRTEYAAITRLQKRLAARGRVAAEVSLVEPVMRVVRQRQIKPERTTLMSLLFKSRWGFGLGAAASAAAVILIIALATPKAQAKAADVMARGARAVARLTSIHLRGQLRTLPADNFGYIDAASDFYPIELWKQLEPELKWRVEKPGRVALMDGQQTLLYIKTAKIANKLASPSSSAFDTDWLHRIANLSNTISNELRHAQAQGWKLGLTEETAADGRLKSVVSVMAKSGLPDDDYCKNKFFENADTRRVYRFDAQTERLEAVRIYLTRSSGEVQIFDLSQIDYDQPIDPSVWQLELPADVSYTQEPQKLSDNQKYASMTVEEAARAFFAACGREDWTEAGKFYSPITDRLKEHLGGLEIVSLGQSFTSKAAAGRFVPYEIKLRPQDVNLRLSNTNAARRYVITGVFDRNLKIQQDLRWSKEPEVLADNDAYAKMSPAEVAKAYFAALSKLDWAEMKKFAPAYDVDNDRRQLEEAKKRGMDVSKLLPVVKVGEAFWSTEQSAFFVKYRQFGIKKHNLALRKDNPAGRWQVHGGI
jgi:post-segregation antitoxin (ccd killing protein)